MVVSSKRTANNWSGVATRLRRGKYSPRVSITASPYLSAVLNYLVTELLYLSSKETNGKLKRRITPRHLRLAIARDESFSVLLKDVVFPGSGVIPAQPLVARSTKKPASGKPTKSTTGKSERIVKPSKTEIDDTELLYRSGCSTHKWEVLNGTKWTPFNRPFSHALEHAYSQWLVNPNGREQSEVKVDFETMLETGRSVCRKIRRVPDL
jgi:hypothetical protein